MNSRTLLVLLASGVLCTQAIPAAELTQQQVAALLAVASAEKPVDFPGKDLSGLDLHGLDFRQANLSRASLRGTNLFQAGLDSVQDVARAKNVQHAIRD